MRIVPLPDRFTPGVSRFGRIAAVAASAVFLLVGPAGVAQAPKATDAPKAAGASKAADGKAADGKAAAAKEAPRPVGDLTTKYLLGEHYTTKNEPVPAGSIGTYRVAFRQTESIATDNPQGAPRRREQTQQAICTERPAAVSSAGDHIVTALVRRYETVRVIPDAFAKLKGVRPFDGLTVWVQIQSGEDPLVISLTQGRELAEHHYQFAARQIFTPNLAALLPETTVRIGDSWQVSKLGARTLVGSPITGDRSWLTGKLVNVQPDPNGPRHIATIDVVGQVSTEDGEVSARAQLLFAFAAPEPKAEDAVVKARGVIEKVSLAQVTTKPMQDVNIDPLSRTGVQKTAIKRELIMERKLGAGASPLPLPASPPKETVEDSWLIYADGKGRFYFRHPQELQLDKGEDPDPNRIVLTRQRGNVNDRVTLEFAQGQLIRPEAHFQNALQGFRDRGVEVTSRPPETLPGSQWPGAHVTMQEAAVSLRTRERGAMRLTFYLYVLQFAQNSSLAVTSLTEADQPKSFRTQLETILKGFRLGTPTEAKAPATSEPPPEGAKPPG